jgi:hypothetical protein
MLLKRATIYYDHYQRKGKCVQYVFIKYFSTDFNSKATHQAYLFQFLVIFSLFVEKLPKHPDYKMAPVDDVSAIKKASLQNKAVFNI